MSTTTRRSRSKSATAAGQEEEHRRHIFPLKTTTCAFCGLRSAGSAAALAHERQCKSRRLCRGVSLTELRCHVSRPTQSADSLPLCPSPSEGEAHPFVDVDSSHGPSCAAVSPVLSGSENSLSQLPSALALSLSTSRPSLLFSSSWTGQPPHCTERARGEVVHDSFRCPCECCGHVSLSPQEMCRHVRVCAATPVHCPLHCGLTLPRGAVPQHLRDTALTHRPLCLPSESDYGGDDPRMVTAILMELLLSRERERKTEEEETAKKKNMVAGQVDEAVESPVTESLREEKGQCTPQPLSRGVSPPAALPPPTQLFNRRPSLDSTSPGRCSQPPSLLSPLRACSKPPRERE